MEKQFPSNGVNDWVVYDTEMLPSRAWPLPSVACHVPEKDRVSASAVFGAQRAKTTKVAAQSGSSLVRVHKDATAAGRRRDRQICTRDAIRCWRVCAIECGPNNPEISIGAEAGRGTGATVTLPDMATVSTAARFFTWA